MFPKNLQQFLFTFIISIIICSPIASLGLIYIEYQKSLFTASYGIFLLVFIGFIHFINYKRKITISYKIKSLNLKFLFFTILIFSILQFIIILPINFYFFSKQSFNGDSYWILNYLILAPILEEIIFRNILLKSLLNIYSRNKAIIISSIMFGLFHGYFPQIIFAGIGGVFLGLIYSKEKNIAHTIILHFFANLFVFTSQYYIIKFHNASFFYVGIAINVLVSFFLLYYMHKKYGYSLLKLIKQK